MMLPGYYIQGRLQSMAARRFPWLYLVTDNRKFMASADDESGRKNFLAHIEKTLVGGVDMVQFGPADYSNSIGLTGQFTHPQVQEAERYMIETAKKMGVAVRVELSQPRDFESYRDMGIKHFNVGIDVRTLYTWFCESGSTMRRELGMGPLTSGTTSQSSYGNKD